jgi:hypothetical protein
VKGQGNNSIELDQNFNPDIGALWLREALPLNLPSGDWIGSLKLHLERDSQINPLSNSTSLDFFLDQRLALKLPVTLITTDLHPEIFTPRLKHVQNIQEGETQRLSLSIGSADNIHPYEVRIIGGNGLSAQPSTLSFSDAVWPQSLDLTIKSSQDDDADSETYLLELYNPEHQHLTLIKTQDPDEQGLLIDTTKGSIKSNQTWSCNLRLKSKPKKEVHVLVSNHNPTAEVFNQQKGLIFTPENWKRPQSLLFQATGEQRYFDKTFFFEFYAAGLDSQSIELVLKSPLDNLNIENLILSEEKLYIEDHLKVTINLNQDTLLQDQVQLRLLESNTKLQLMWNGRQALANLKLSQTGNFTLMAEIIGQQGTQVTKSFEVTAHPLTPQMDLSALSPIMAHQLKEVSPHLDEQEGSSVLSELISTITSAEMIIASEAFLSTVNSGETKSFNSGQHAITVSHVQLSHEEIHLDKGSFPLSLSGVPEDHVIMVSSSPLALNDTSLKLPSGSIGQLFVFELRKGAEDIENGFDIKLRLKNMAKTGIISSLYVQGENGLFSPSDADISIENQDLIATMKHFSTFTLVEEALVTETNLQNDSGVQAETLPVEMATAETHQESESSFQTSVDSSITTPISNNPDHINKESATEGSAGGGGGGCLLNNTIKAIKLKDLLVRHR